MISTAQVSSLTIEEAAEFLGMCKETLYGLAASGEVTGIKKGKEWRFLDIHLIDYIEQEHAKLTRQKGKDTCPSTDVKTPKARRKIIGGSDCVTQTADELLDNLLGPATSAKPKKLKIV